MVNEIALVLLFGLFGWRIALLYMSTGLLIALFTGLVIGRLDMERQVEDWVYEIRMGQTSGPLADHDLDGAGSITACTRSEKSWAESGPISL